jgi:5-methylthioadenosine/S-adenosylhomocysteine deaminase
LSVNTETILVNGLILSDPAHPEVVPHGKTIINGNSLLQVNVSNHSEFPLDNIIDCSNCLIMPGLVNAHTHASMSLLRGIADDLPLDQWLNKYIFPSEAKHAGPQFVYLGTCLSAMEMALNGITTFADGYFRMENAARAAMDVGLRAVVAQGILDVPTPDAPLPGSWRKRADKFLDNCPADSLITRALFCHSPYLCSPETLQAARRLSRERGILLFCHVSETAQEVDEILRKHGVRPVELLHRLGILGRDFVAVHAVHVSDAEQEMLAKSHTGVVHCPESNMKLASGTAPVVEFMAKGITLGIGTDGPASNNNLDLLEEMRAASLMAKLVTGDPQALGARAVLRMATIDGAKVLGMDDRIGSLEPGKLADLTVINLNHPHLTPLYDPISHLAYAARGSDVRHVMVNGRWVVRDGRIITVDQESLMAKARGVAANIGRDLGITTYGDFLTNE